MKIIKFQERFKELILSHSKRSTIRNDKNRQYRVGTTFCFKCVRNGRNLGLFASSTIISVTPIRIEVYPRSIFIYDGLKWSKIPEHDLNDFYKQEGFNNENDFYSFFSAPFKGYLIFWSNPIQRLPYTGPTLFPPDA